MILKNYKQCFQLLKNLGANTPIYIAGHINPDYDSICSCYALAHLLNKQNKNVFILTNSKDYILPWQDDEIKIADNINTKEYFFISLDLNEPKRLGDFSKFVANAKLSINIDHHQNNAFFSNYTLSKPKFSSTCEIIYCICKNEPNFLDKKTASLLYCGMLNDTNGFTRRLTKSTLNIAQKFINIGINYREIIKTTFANRTLYEVKATAEIVKNIVFDDFHYAVIDKSKKEYKDLSYNSIVKKIAEDLRRITDLKTFVIFIKTNNQIQAKVMTNVSENANQIAEIFGGGGHKKEAGFTVIGEEIPNMVLKIKEFLNNN